MCKKKLLTDFICQIITNKREYSHKMQKLLWICIMYIKIYNFRTIYFSSSPPHSVKPIYAQAATTSGAFANEFHFSLILNVLHTVESSKKCVCEKNKKKMYEKLFCKKINYIIQKNYWIITSRIKAKQGKI